MIKIGLIGCGGISSAHVQSYQAMGNKVQIVAVADLDREKAEKTVQITGGEIYASADDLLENAKGLDMVDICLPTYLHAKYAVMAMEKGYHVFVEKPMCLNLEEAELMRQAQKKTGKKLQVGQVIRFWNEYLWVKKTMEDGRYGKLVSGVFQRLSPNPKWAWENWFNDYKRSGSMALDLHVHDVDFVRFLMGGEPDEVTASATRDAQGVVQQIFATYRYGDAVITTEGCWDFPDNFPFSMNYRVKLEKATVVFGPDGLVVYTQDGEEFRPQLEETVADNGESQINVSGVDAYYNELLYFITCLANGQEPVVATLDEAARSIQLVQKELELAGGVKR